MRRKLIIVSSIIIFVLLSVILVLKHVVESPLEVKDYVTVSISISALIVAFISNFKSEVFDFELKILSGSVLLLPIVLRGNYMILPITFVNKGYADGFIEMIVVKVTRNYQKRIYTSSDDHNEESYNALLRFEEKDDKQTSIPFSGFPLSSKQSLKKYIGFGIESTEFSEWQEGNYRFELFIKMSQCNKFKQFSKFEHSIEAEKITWFNRGKPVYLQSPLEMALSKQIEEL
jgi:hypothetical protein